MLLRTAIRHHDGIHQRDAQTCRLHRTWTRYLNRATEPRDYVTDEIQPARVRNPVGIL